MEFRVLSNYDYILIHELDKTAFQDFWSADIFRNELVLSTRRYIGMFDGDTLVGYIGMNIVIDECDIIRIAIHKDYQGNGYSKLLFKNAIEYMRNIAVTKILLEVSHINTIAISLYERLGFKKIFHRPHYYHDGSDALIYELLI